MAAQVSTLFCRTSLKLKAAGQTHPCRRNSFMRVSLPLLVRIRREPSFRVM